ncbi:MAG: stage II sporulation protein M [Aggregatilineales bacterium]
MTTTAKLNTSITDTPQNTVQQRTFRQTMSNAMIITRREVKDSFRDWRIVGPIILLTFFFPYLAQNIAAGFAGFLSGFGAEIIGERTIPFLLMVVGFFPISISLVIALETFVGEKERRSLEPLLSTPLTNTELYIGKTLAAMIPPLIASFGGMSVYLIILLSGELAWRPQGMLIVQIFMLTIIQALVMVTGAVVVSSQTTSTRASNLLASFIIIPMTLVINGESIIMFLAPDANSPNGIAALWAIMVGMATVVILLLRMGNSIFNREELLGRNIDALNIGGTFGKIGRYIRAVDDEGHVATNLVDWYRRAIPYTLRKMRPALFLTMAVFALAFLVGFGFGMIPQWQLPLDADAATLGQGATIIDSVLTDSLKQKAVMLIVWQNGRVLLLAAVLSLFSFGVAAYIIPPLVYAVLGYIFGQMLLSGLDLTLFFAGLLPHGIVEIPVIIIATAAMFRLGAIITKPPAGKTVGHALTVTLADGIKVTLGLIIPGLIIAALIEVYVTFSVLQAVMG